MTALAHLCPISREDFWEVNWENLLDQIIAKSVTINKQELMKFKGKIMNELKSNGVDK